MRKLDKRKNTRDRSHDRHKIPRLEIEALRSKLISNMTETCGGVVNTFNEDAMTVWNTSAVQHGYSYPDPRLESCSRPCSYNGKTYEYCKVGTQDILLILRKQFYNHSRKVLQDTLLCRYMCVMMAKRHRESKEIRARKATVCYMSKSVKNGVRVCKGFFAVIFGIPYNRLTTVAKVLETDAFLMKKGKGIGSPRKAQLKKEKVPDFIVKKLYRMYIKKCAPNDWVSYDMFGNVFIHDFNIGFSFPPSDVCSKCTRLKEQLKQSNDPEKKNNIILEYRMHKKIANTFYELCRENPDNSITSTGSASSPYTYWRCLLCS
ncbi:unnamed protein product [Psylliodes chrysocephalus]|uniref:Uncharacterized protein n=1 Tax=Psylliodes chrysocephalus TaxID=3402493 RepID=A0A9P0CM78_9CUCU|nr:unnamed protein product [Psylliodes chrysocephala]